MKIWPAGHRELATELHVLLKLKQFAKEGNLIRDRMTLNHCHPLYIDVIWAGRDHFYLRGWCLYLVGDYALFRYRFRCPRWKSTMVWRPWSIPLATVR